MLYSVLDNGNFYVIPGSSVDVWTTDSCEASTKDYGFNDDETVVLVVGSSFFYGELSCDYAVAMHVMGPLLIRYARRNDAGGSFKFIFLCCNSTDGYNDTSQVSCC